MNDPVIPERYKPLLEKRQLFCLRDILQELGTAEAEVVELELELSVMSLRALSAEKIAGISK